MRNLLIGILLGGILSSGLAWAGHDLLEQMQQRQERFDQQVERQQQQMQRNNDNLERMTKPPC